MVAILLAVFLIARSRQTQSTSKSAYTRITEERERKDRTMMAQQIADFAVRSGAITNQWSLPVVTGLKTGRPSVTGSELRERFAHETNAVVIAMVPSELKFSAADDLPKDHNHVLVGINVNHAVTDATLRYEIAVKGNFWQSIQRGSGRASELLVAVRGIRFETQSIRPLGKTVFVLKGHARDFQWLEPAEIE